MKATEQTLLRMIHEDTREHSEQKLKERKAAVAKNHEAELKQLEAENEKQRILYEKTLKSELKRQLESKVSAMERDLLSYRQQLLDDIFRRAVLTLRNLPASDLADLLIRAVRPLKGSFTLCVGEYSKGKLTAKDAAHAAAQADGLTLTLSDTLIPQKSGFLLMDERAEYSCLFEDLIEEKKGEHVAAIQKEIFQGDEGRLSVPNLFE